METRSRSKVKGTTSPPRAATVGGAQPVRDVFVDPPSSAAGLLGDGRISSRYTSLEAGPCRTCRPTARSESTGETRGPAQGAKSDENRVVVDTLSNEKVLIPTPDEGWNSTLVLFAESRNSESQESSDASPRGLPTSGADHNIKVASQVSPDRSAPGPFNVAGAGIILTEDRQPQVGVGYPQVRPALTSVTS